MSFVTISNGATTITPWLRLTANATWPSRNTVHDLLGDGVAVTFGSEALRRTTLDLLFATEAAAAAAVTFHRAGHVFELTDAANPSTNMHYVVNGSLRYELDRDTARRWLVRIDVQEVQV